MHKRSKLGQVKKNVDSSFRIREPVQKSYIPAFDEPGLRTKSKNRISHRNHVVDIRFPENRRDRVQKVQKRKLDCAGHTIGVLPRIGGALVFTAIFFSNNLGLEPRTFPLWVGVTIQLSQS